MSTLKGTTMHPRCRHIGETSYLNFDFSSSAQVKFNFELFLKKNLIFGSHVVVLEAFSIDVSITNVGLILTKLR